MKAEIKVRVEPAMMESVRALSKIRGQSMSEYVARATRNQLIADGAGMEADTIRKRISEANEPLTRSANFAAVHAAATLAFMREWLRETFIRQGIPDDLARQKAELLRESALSEALEAFEDPRNLHQFGWIERPESEADLPSWLTDIRVITASHSATCQPFMRSFAHVSPVSHCGMWKAMHPKVSHHRENSNYLQLPLCPVLLCCDHGAGNNEALQGLGLERGFSV